MPLPKCNFYQAHELNMYTCYVNCLIINMHQKIFIVSCNRSIQTTPRDNLMHLSVFSYVQLITLTKFGSDFQHSKNSFYMQQLLIETNCLHFKHHFLSLNSISFFLLGYVRQRAMKKYLEEPSAFQIITDNFEVIST